MANKWLTRINPFQGSEVKSLRAELDKVTQEIGDDYNVKYLDSDPSPYSGSSTDSFAGVDTQIDNGVLARLYASETWVYVAVRAITDTIAGLPVTLEKRKMVTQQITNPYTQTPESVDKEVWLDATGEKLFRKFQFPNEYTTKAEFLSLIAIDLLTCGEYYIYLEAQPGTDLTSQTRDTLTDSADPEAPMNRLLAALGAESKVQAMYRIPPQLMKPIPSEDRRGILGYAMTSDHGVYAYNFAEVIHVKLPNPADNFRGLSPLVAALKPVLLDRFSTEHMIRFYKAGARLGGVITTEKNLGKEQLSRFQRSFEASYTGRNNHHRTLILPPGMDYKQVEQNPAETALLEFCKYNREAILSTMRVPPIKVGILDKANYANAQVQLKIFFEDTIKPLLTFIEDGFNHKSVLMPAGGNFRFKFDLSDVEALKENFKEKAETAKFMMDGGLSVNEVRARVWDAPPVADGEKVKVIENIKAGKTDEAGTFGELSAPRGSMKESDGTASPIASELKTELTGPQTTAVMNILGRVAKGRLTKEQAAELIISAYGIPRELACKLTGTPYTPPTPIVQPEAAKDTTGGAQTAPEWTPTAVGTGAPVPEGNLCATCKKQPCECPPGSKGQGGPSLGEYISDALSKLSPGESITADFVADLIKIHSESYPQTAAKEIIPTTSEDRMYPTGHSKAEIIDQWKSFITKTDPLVAKRQAELKAFFSKVKSAVLNRLGANVKSFGVHKARDKDDADDITKLTNYEALIKQYIAEVDKALAEAFAEGFNTTLTTFKFGDPAEAAKKFLDEYAGDKITGIMQTTMDQVHTVLSEGFSAGKSIGDISKSISDKFTEIDTGRAHTIARTETLTAVSAGREQKRVEFKKQFPETKLMKMWVSAQDDRVRDSHADLDGKSVGADEAFDNGLMYPRDPSGDAEEVINCRCTDITFNADDKSAVEDTLSDDGEADADREANEDAEGEKDET